MTPSVVRSGALAFALALAPAALEATPEAPEARPNVLVVMVDDLDQRSFDTLVGDGWLPRISEALVEDGVAFRQSFVTNSLCCPSRATFLSGQYSHNHGVLDVSVGIRHWLTPDLAPQGEKETLATWLQAAGYHTGHVGKYLNGYGMAPVAPTYVPPGYDDWQALVDPSTYSVYDYQLNDNGHVVQYGDAPEDYQTDVLAGRARRFLDRRASAAPEKPFFLVVTPMAPHVEMKPADILLNQVMGYRSHFRETIRPAPRHAYVAMPGSPRRPAFNEADVTDKPPFVQGLPVLGRARGDFLALDRQYGDRLASMLAVDELVGSLVDQLRAQGELEQTVIVFTSDNGYLFGEHRLSSKMLAYEESIHVPLVVRGPGFAPGVRDAAMVLNNDLAPTIAALTGITPTRTVDGLSLVPLLAGDGTRDWPRQRLLVEHFREKHIVIGGMDVLGDLAPPPFAAVRGEGAAGPYLYVEWYEDELVPGRVTFREHYDLATDPHQLTNDAALLPALRLEALAETLAALKACKGDTCRALEAGE